MASERRIVPLDGTHDRAGFDCGVDSLDSFLKERALKHAKAGYSRTYVLLGGDDASIMAYYAICSGEFERELLPEEALKKTPKHAVPVLRLCRLAADLKHRRKGLGAVMLVDALRRAVEISRQIGVRAVEVDALSEDARAFYLKHGFHSLKDDLKHLYLPIRTATALFDK